MGEFNKKLKQFIEYYFKHSDVEEMHCTKCGRFLGKGKILAGQIELKCKSCKQINTYTIVNIEKNQK